MAVDKIYIFPTDRLDCLIRDCFPDETRISCGQLQSTLGKLLIQAIVYQKHGIDFANQQYCKGKYGKPYLANLVNFHYNISHTDGIIVVGISSAPIGIDIEKLQPPNLAISQRFFTQNEQAYLVSQTEDEQSRRFCQIWTAKEAYLKYLGIGLSGISVFFDVLSAPLANHLTCIHLKNDYILTICRKDNSRPFNLVEPDTYMIDNLLFCVKEHLSENN